MIRLPIFILLWAGFVAIKFVTMVLGLFVIPFLSKYRDVLYSELPSWTRPWANPEDWYGGPKTFNKTSLPKWWWEKHGKSNWSFYKYHAIRNPANGLRSFEFLDLDIDMTKVRFVTNSFLAYYEPWFIRAEASTTAYYICWQGFQAGVKYVHIWPDKKTDLTIKLPAIDFGDTWWKVWNWAFSLKTTVLIPAGPKHFVLKFGWRVEPRDATIGIDPEGIRVDDAGFASKLLPYRNG